MNALLSQDEIDGLFDDEPAPAVFKFTGASHVPTISHGVIYNASLSNDNMGYADGAGYREVSTLRVPGQNTTATFLSATLPTDALLHGAGDTMAGVSNVSGVLLVDDIPPLLSRGLAADLGLEGYFGDVTPLYAPGVGNVIDGGTVSISVDTGAWTNAAPLGGDLDDEEEFFLDESPDGFGWCLIPDAKRNAWNALCAGFEPNAFDDVDDPPTLHLPDWVKVIEGHPRWTVFKRPRQKFS